MLENEGLELVGLAGGTVEERLRYCGGILAPRYLSVDTITDDAAVLASKGHIRLALHPRRTQPSET